MELVAPNGERVTVRNEFQAEVFIKAGFVPVDEKKRPPKTQEQQ